MFPVSASRMKPDSFRHLTWLMRSGSECSITNRMQSIPPVASIVFWCKANLASFADSASPVFSKPSIWASRFANPARCNANSLLSCACCAMYSSGIFALNSSPLLSRLVNFAMNFIRSDRYPRKLASQSVTIALQTPCELSASSFGASAWLIHADTVPLNRRAYPVQSASFAMTLLLPRLSPCLIRTTVPRRLCVLISHGKRRARYRARFFQFAVNGLDGVLDGGFGEADPLH